MTALVIAEHDNSAVARSTLHAITAAKKCDSEVHVIVVGKDPATVAIVLTKVSGVSRVLVADAPHFAEGIAEDVANQIFSIARHYSHIVAAATAYGKNILPRVAATLDVAQLSDITSVVSSDTFERPIYAGNVIATVKSNDPIKVVTVRTTAFDAATSDGNASAPVEAVATVADASLSRFVSREVTKTDRPELASASIVVSGGRGLGSGENYEKVLTPLADRLGAALGASRAAVDAGFVPNDYQVGQTGKIVAPQLYIAVGISGAIQHLAGMKGSKVIVAINKDSEAPIFSVADYGLVADLNSAVPELVTKL